MAYQQRADFVFKTESDSQLTANSVTFKPPSLFDSSLVVYSETHCTLQLYFLTFYEQKSRHLVFVTSRRFIHFTKRNVKEGRKRKNATQRIDNAAMKQTSPPPKFILELKIPQQQVADAKIQRDALDFCRC